MTTGNPDGASSGYDARADDPPLVDGVHQAHVRTTGGTDVPHRSETGEQRLSGVHDTAECRVHRSLGDVTMNPISFEIAGQMDVHVGKTGEKRHVSQLDHLGVGRRLCANGLDAVTEMTTVAGLSICPVRTFSMRAAWTKMVWADASAGMIESATNSVTTR